MEDNQIETLIDKKVAEAKLSVAESRLHWFTGIFAILFTMLVGIFGIMIPLYTVNKASDKVDLMKDQLKTQMDAYGKNIQDDSKANEGAIKKELEAMRKDFKELAGQQSRNPKLVCQLEDGSTLEGNVFVYSPSKPIKIRINNTGDAATRGGITVRLYTNFSTEATLSNFGPVSRRLTWLPSESDEKGYNNVFELTNFYKIEPGIPRTIEISFQLLPATVKPAEYPMLLKVSYDPLPSPLKYTFRLNIVDADKGHISQP